LKSTLDKKTFFDERNRKVIRPDHKLITSRPSAYGLVLRDEKILFSRCAHTGLLDLPGGEIEQGETINECIEREGLEETGYRLRRISQEPVAVLERQFYWSGTDQYFMSLMLIYPANVVGEPEPDWKPDDSNEVSEVVWAMAQCLLQREVTPCYFEPVWKFVASQGLPLLTGL